VRVALFVLGALVLVVMSIAAHSLAYFPGDVAISHVVQAYPSEWLDSAFDAISWIGFPPQSNFFFGALVVSLFVFGCRWAAVAEAIAALGGGGLYLLLEPVVGQPRPSAELVRVVGSIQMTGFPSGHLATFTAGLGFVVYFGYQRLGSSNLRWLPVGLLVVFLALMGIARIYAGHHWASDVLAGCLLGALWLAIVIRLYEWRAAHARRPAGVNR
jgi:membrane-associated phospholipid phosphatase